MDLDDYLWGRGLLSFYKKQKQKQSILERLYMLETTEPAIHTKKAYTEEDEIRQELRNNLKKLLKYSLFHKQQQFVVGVFTLLNITCKKSENIY